MRLYQSFSTVRKRLKRINNKSELIKKTYGTFLMFHTFFFIPIRILLLKNIEENSKLSSEN